jgi:hypothetical protein
MSSEDPQSSKVELNEIQQASALVTRLLPLLKNIVRIPIGPEARTAQSNSMAFAGIGLVVYIGLVTVKKATTLGVEVNVEVSSFWVAWLACVLSLFFLCRYWYLLQPDLLQYKMLRAISMAKIQDEFRPVDEIIARKDERIREIGREESSKGGPLDDIMDKITRAVEDLLQATEAKLKPYKPLIKIVGRQQSTIGYFDGAYQLLEITFPVALSGVLLVLLLVHSASNIWLFVYSHVQY